MNPVNNKLSVTYLNNIKEKTPFMVVDLQTVKDKYNNLRRLLPAVGVYYAVKSNPESEILKTLDKQGSNFEIASIGELKRLIKIGVNTSRIIYSNPVKPFEQIKEAFQLGVRFFAYDSPEELIKISKAAPGSSVYLRMAVSNHGSLIDLSNKFGANKSHAVSLLSLAEDLGLKLFGIAFHVGSQSENMQLWDQAFEDATDIMNQLEKQGIKIDTLNIGGGFPIQYTEKIPTMEEICRRIRKNIEKLPYQPKLLCEPGRYIIGEAAVIASTVIGKATRYNKPWLYMDTGRFQSFIEMFESDDLHYPIFTSVDEQSGSKPTSLYTITGPTCDSYDTIDRDVALPTRLQEGDRVYFASTGAYTLVYGAPFNDFAVPKIIFRN